MSKCYEIKLYRLRGRRGPCFRDNSALATHNMETGLQRFVVDPAQALAYKIGELRMKQLREKATAALGDRLDVRAFHDTMLLGGALPLEMLEQRIDAWLKEKGGR